MIQEAIDLGTGAVWRRPLPGGEWECVPGAGDYIWAGRTSKGATIAIPQAAPYRYLSFELSGSAVCGLAVHAVTSAGKHVISGIAGYSADAGMNVNGIYLESDDGAEWLVKDGWIYSMWGSGADIGQQQSAFSNAHLALKGMMPGEPVTFQKAG